MTDRKTNMDAKTCLEKLGYVGVLSFAAVGENGSPQYGTPRPHDGPEAMRFFTDKAAQANQT